MLSEVSSVNLEDWDDYGQSFSKSLSLSPHFHKQILSQNYGANLDRTKNIPPCNLQNHNPTNQKVQKVFSDSPVGANVGGEVSVTFKWGGEEGTSVSGSASVNASDDNGNTVTVTAEVNDDGSREVSASASHDDDKSSK